MSDSKNDLQTDMATDRHGNPAKVTPRTSWHRDMLEGKSGLFAVLATVSISIGGLAEIVPMFSVGHGEPMAEVTPYSPLELAGRDLYIREGCVNCHSQMVRPFRAETLRYGEWTRAEELIYERPFLLGSRRIGPDLQRVGGKYPDAWHYEHMKDPRSTSPGSIMPPYPWLLDGRLDVDGTVASMEALQTLGHPYTDEDIAAAPKAMANQGLKIAESLGKTGIQTSPDTEIVALIAYLQRLGTDGRAGLKAREAAAEGAAPEADGAAMVTE